MEAKNRPLLSSCSSSYVSMMLLRLCTVREVSVGGFGDNPVGLVWLDVWSGALSFLSPLRFCFDTSSHKFEFCGIGIP